MPNKEQLLNWILENGLKGKLSDTYQKLQDLIQVDIDDDDEPDLEQMVVSALGRDLTAQEIYKLRPVIMEIYSYYYGEE